MIQVEFEEGKKLREKCRCAQCGAGLTVAWGGAFGIDSYVLRCAEEARHEGIISRPRLPAVTGEKLGALAVEDPQQLAALVMAKATDERLTYPAAVLFSYQALRLGLDPLANEVFPAVFKNKRTGKVTVVPIVSEAGYGSLAARACPDAWNGPPATTPVTDPALREYVANDREAWVWEARGRRKDWEPGREYTTYGWMTRAQWEEARKQMTPAGQLPGNQARVRAVKRWIQEAYPEAMSLTRQMRAELVQQAEGVPQAMEVIEAEYRVVETGEQGLEVPGDAQPLKEAQAPKGEPPRASEAQLRAIHAIARGKGITDRELHQMARAESLKDLNVPQASALIDALKKEPKRQEESMAQKQP
jgi:hypothetical protein